jgi:hypothetical protein
MRKAVDNNFKIVVHIHLDDGVDKGTWRNVMIFNPIQKYGAHTYYDTVVKPTADAVKGANYKGGEVYFAMQVRSAGQQQQRQNKLQALVKAQNTLVGVQ